MREGATGRYDPATEAAKLKLFGSIGLKEWAKATGRDEYGRKRS